MSESQSKQTLDRLIDEAREGAMQPQQATHSLNSQHPTHRRLKKILGLLLATFVAVIFTQYPRIQAPYAWRDAKSSPAVVAADLEAVAGLIEIYRFSQGQYPAVLSQVALPTGLAELVVSSVLIYRPVDAVYTLDWTLPHWRASYDSRTEKTNVEPMGKR